MYGGQFQRVPPFTTAETKSSRASGVAGVDNKGESWEQFRKAVSQGLNTGGLHVIEVPTERTSNVKMHRQLWEVIGKTLNERGIGMRD
jgi:2-succinyl-5-enolpyruvyl-6-hydroxy-3-cyclohexene-1-carboxylate synthase